MPMTMLRKPLSITLGAVLLYTLLLVSLISPPVLSQGGDFTETLLNAVSTGTGSVSLNANHGELTVFVEWGASTTAGVVEIEEAYATTYGDTWATVATITWSAADVVAIRHLPTGSYRAIRTRVSTTIVGGTINARISGR